MSNGASKHWARNASLQSSHYCDLCSVSFVEKHGNFETCVRKSDLRLASREKELRSLSRLWLLMMGKFCSFTFTNAWRLSAVSPLCDKKMKKWFLWWLSDKQTSRWRNFCSIPAEVVLSASQPILHGSSASDAVALKCSLVSTLTIFVLGSFGWFYVIRLVAHPFSLNSEAHQALSSSASNSATNGARSTDSPNRCFDLLQESAVEVINLFVFVSM